MRRFQVGQSLTEFALVLPMTLLLLLGLVVFGMAFARLEAVQNAASEGGRAAQVWLTQAESTCVEAVNQAVLRSTPFVPDTVNVSCSPSIVDGRADWCCPSDTITRVPVGSLITVSVVEDYEPLFFGTLFKGAWEPPSTMPIQANITIMHE